MRGMIENLPSPVPVASRLPGVLQDDDMLQRFTAALDETLAPVYLTLDALACYVDPDLAPADFLEWLCTWVGIEPDETWTTERRRQIVARASAVHRWRGTSRGIEEAVRLVVEGEVEVSDSGGTSWSAASAGALPGSATPAVVVRVSPDGPVDRRRVERVLGSVVAAHVPFILEIDDGTP